MDYEINETPMDKSMLDLLEFMNEFSYGEVNVDVKTLLETEFPERIIIKAVDEGLIHTVGSNLFIGSLPSAELNEKAVCELTVKGLEIATLLRTGESTEKLNKSLIQFDNSSRRYSKMMVVLTVAIAILTATLILEPFIR